MGIGLYLKSYVKTLVGTSAQTLGTGLVPTNTLIQADTGDTVYIGSDPALSASTGFLVPTLAPIALGALFNAGNIEHIDLSQVYVVGGSGDVVRLLYANRSA